MKISYADFHRQLLGARYCDEHRWTKLNQEACLFSIFAFDDTGAHYIGGTHKPEQDWSRKRWWCSSEAGARLLGLPRRCRARA